MILDLKTIINDQPPAIRQFLFQAIRNDWARLQCYAQGVDMEWEEINWVMDDDYVSTVRPLRDYECLAKCRNEIVLALRLPLKERFVSTAGENVHDPLSLDDYLSLITIPQHYHKVVKRAAVGDDFEVVIKRVLEIINSDDDLYHRLLVSNLLLINSGYIPWLPPVSVIDDLQTLPLTGVVFKITYQAYLDYMVNAVPSWKPTIEPGN